LTTSRHDAGNLFCSIESIKFAYEKANGSGTFKFRHVIIDSCWASIHSLNQSLNGEKSQINSDHVFGIAEGSQIIDTNKSYIHICKGHKSHAVSVGCKLIIVKKLKKNSEEYKNVYYLFMFAFTLLQNSIDLKMFVEYFKDICMVFGSRFKSKEWVDALKRIKTAINIRPSDQDEFELIYSSSEKSLNEANSKGIDLEIDYDSEEVKIAKDTFKSKSKFYLKCFDTKNIVFNKIIENCENENNEINSFFFVDLVFYLLEKHIPYAAWWSGFTYSGIDLNVNNARLESKIKEKKRQTHLGHQPDMYINKSLSLIKGNFE
jgi:hypothetical protein